MHERDFYASFVSERDSKLGLIRYETRVHTEIVGAIHEKVVSEEVPDYALEIFGGAITKLAQWAIQYARSSPIIVPTADAARSHAEERLMLLTNERLEKRQIPIFYAELGSLGITTLALNYSDEVWNLDYESTFRAVLLGRD